MFLLETLEYYDTFFNWVEIFGKVITPKYPNPSPNSQNKQLNIFRNPNILAVKTHTPYFFLYNFSHVIFFSSSFFFYFVFLILMKERNVNLFQWNRRQPNFFPMLWLSLTLFGYVTKLQVHRVSHLREMLMCHIWVKVTHYMQE